MEKTQTIVLITCVKEKQDKKCKAEELYISAFFKKNLAYAKSLNPDKIFILSAKHGLLPLDREIEPYNLTLNNFKSRALKNWAEGVLQQLQKETDLDKDHFILLAGENYRKYLLPEIKNYEIPLKGLPIGKQLQFLTNNDQMTNLYDRLHELFNKAKRFHFPFEKDIHQIPKNGVYIIFEKGEKYKAWDRIVRVGTHRGDNQLRSRLNQHFLKKNKNRSIFRKNIGRCLLNQENHPYLSTWELDTTSRKNKDKYGHLIDKNFEFDLENQISKYIQDNLTFTVFEVNDQKDRLFWESRIISTLATFPDISPSDHWLGRWSPKKKIRKVGLWQVNELFNQPLDNDEFNKLTELVRSNNQGTMG